MKPSSLTVFLVIFAFGFLTPWVVEGGFQERCKPGACPFLRPRKCIGHEPSECWNDWQCPQRQKCCSNGCGRECMDPVFAEDSGEKVESWKWGPRRFELEDTHPEEVESAPLNWDGGWDRARDPPPPALYAQVGSGSIREPVSQLANQLMNQSVCQTHTTLVRVPLVGRSLL